MPSCSGKCAGIRIVFLACFPAALVAAQSTQGLILGRLLDSRTAQPVSGAHIECSEDSTNTHFGATSDAEGFYSLPLLSPGNYSVRVTAPGYQSQEAQNLELNVAGRLELTFLLRPLKDVWEAGLYRSVILPGGQTVVTFFGPDVDTSHSGNFEGNRGQQGALESTVSDVISPVALDNLPLAGRDAYTLVFTLPAVTSDGGVSFGLGLSVNGQRPSSSNYLLDGVENNNYLVTGPLTPIAPEAIQEYRISESDFSAQYGRTAGFVANAVTKSGASQWHGLVYYYTRNEALDSNSFQGNLQGFARTLDREVRPGFQAGGPLWRKRLFISVAAEHFEGRQREEPQTFWFPTSALEAALAPGSPGANLLTQYPSPLPPNPNPQPCSLSSQAGCYASELLSPPLSLNQDTGLLRLDYVSPGGAHRVTTRASASRLNRPNFLWSPYAASTQGYDQPDVSVMVSDQYTITPRLTNEARAAYGLDQVGWGEPGQAPTLQVHIPVSAQGLTLPGANPAYPYSSYDSSIELLDNLTWTRGRHMLTTGAGVLLRHLNGFVDYEGNGTYEFGNLTQFMRGTPSVLLTSISRSDLANPTAPDFGSTYQNREYFLFAQDSFRATSRLTLNFGLRYENLGAAQSIGPQPNAVLELGPGSNLIQRLQDATLSLSGGPSGYLYQPDNLDFAPRLGFSYSLFGNGNTLFRGGYGIFYDRPFDNLWETVRANSLDYAQFTFAGAAVDFTQPIAQVLPAYAENYHALITSVPNLTLFQPNLRNGYAQDIFLGIQQRFTSTFTLEVNGLSALDRRLLTNDTLGYNNLFNGTQPGIPAGQLVTYRANQGKADYYGLAIKALYRSGRSLLQAAYTWSHSIDTQSDPLGLDLSNFGFSSGNLLPAVPAALIAGFAQPQNSQGDRGSSDFDERQNLVVQASFDLPGVRAGRVLSFLTRNWTIAGVGAVRSGFPFTVYTPGGMKGYSRANITDPALTRGNRTPGPGGVYLLSLAGFSGVGGPGVPSGRNAFTGPGFVNLDAGVSRSFGLHPLPESWRLTFRADFFNVMNHANLNAPFPVYVPGETGFGLATFGLNAIPSGFPTPLPLGQTPRQIELSVHLRF
ncbi:MAG TPA: carboxypeptidase regulatory-like domain-containing protein [Bryobacteraceae bacterium]